MGNLATAFIASFHCSKALSPGGGSILNFILVSIPTRQIYFISIPRRYKKYVLTKQAFIISVDKEVIFTA
jgi:hypothetical protein